jgi:hypothetical protein
MAGAQTVPGAMPFEPYGIENAAEMHPDDYAARALGCTADAVIEHLGLGGGVLVNYTELPDAVEARILPHFGIIPDEQGRRALAAASGRDAKAPLERFTRDSDAKQQAANAKLRANAALHMDEPYRRLEELRRTDGK